MLLLLLAAAGLAASPAAAADLDLKALCVTRGAAPLEGARLSVDGEPLVLVDKGFCQAYLFSEAELDGREMLAKIGAGGPRRTPWTVRFYASHAFTTYFKSDVHFRATGYDLVVEDYPWAERSSRKYFEPETWTKDGNNPLQVFDEPTNTFVLSLEREGSEYFLSAFHPKFLQAKGQAARMKGLANGVEVDGFLPLEDVTGAGIVRNEDTYREMQFELGYGRRFRFLASRRGSFALVPRASAGVMVGGAVTVTLPPGGGWDFEEHDDRWRVQGFGGTAGLRLEFNGAKDRLGVFVEERASYYRLQTGFKDGVETFGLGFVNTNVGLRAAVWKPKRAAPDDPFQD